MGTAGCLGFGVGWVVGTVGNDVILVEVPGLVCSLALVGHLDNSTGR